MVALSDPPLVTVALLTWNSERFVESALSAVMAQDYSPLEIIVSDDASKDGTWTIVEGIAAAYRGSHRLRLIRNERNLGVGAHCAQVIEQARGELVVLSAGDDISEANRVSAIAQVWLSDPDRIACLASQATGIDEFGRGSAVVEACTFGSNVDAIKLAQSGEALLGATLAVHRRVMEVFGPLGEDLKACEDIVLPFRAALLGKIAIVDQPLLRYRRHGASLLASGGPLAANAREYRNGFVRMLEGHASARKHQLADLALALKVGAIDQGRHDILAFLLRGHLMRESSYADLLQRRSGSLIAFAKLALAGQFGLRDMAKMLLAAFATTPWYHFQRWRLPRVSMSNPS